MEINKKLITHVAKLARIRLTHAEIERFQSDLKDVLSAFSKLDKVDTKDIKPSFHPIELKNVLREDIAEKPITQDDALSLTKHKKEGYFKGPRVV